MELKAPIIFSLGIGSAIVRVYTNAGAVEQKIPATVLKITDIVTFLFSTVATLYLLYHQKFLMSTHLLGFVFLSETSRMISGVKEKTQLIFGVTLIQSCVLLVLACRKNGYIIKNVSQLKLS